MNRNYFLTFLVLILVFGIGFFLFNSKNSHPTTATSNNLSLAPNDKLPNLIFKDYSGRKVALTDFAGKPLVINAWASWCPFCRQELPGLAAAQKEFGDRVVIIAIDRQESLEVAKGYTDQQGTTGKLVFLLDPTDSFYQAIGGFSMPETIFADKNGNVVDHKRGPMDASEIRARTEKILN